MLPYHDVAAVEAAFAGRCELNASSARKIICNTAYLSIMAFCGVQVPMSFWPQWIQTLAAAVPLTHSPTHPDRHHRLRGIASAHAAAGPHGNVRRHAKRSPAVGIRCRGQVVVRSAMSWQTRNTSFTQSAGRRGS